MQYGVAWVGGIGAELALKTKSCAVRTDSSGGPSMGKHLFTFIDRLLTPPHWGS